MNENPFVLSSDLETFHWNGHAHFVSSVEVLHPLGISVILQCRQSCSLCYKLKSDQWQFAANLFKFPGRKKRPTRKSPNMPAQFYGILCVYLVKHFRIAIGSVRQLYRLTILFKKVTLVRKINFKTLNKKLTLRFVRSVTISQNYKPRSKLSSFSTCKIKSYTDRISCTSTSTS